MAKKTEDIYKNIIPEENDATNNRVVTVQQNSPLSPDYTPNKGAGINLTTVTPTINISSQTNKSRDKNPFEALDKQAEEIQHQTNTTLQDLYRRRKELEDKYSKGIRDQRTVIKINAIGKLIAALGQLAGGGRGKIVEDRDPYQINAFKTLDQLNQEQRFYSKHLSDQESAYLRSMTDRLNKIALEKAKLQTKEEVNQRNHDRALELENTRQKNRKEVLNIKAQNTAERQKNTYENQKKVRSAKDENQRKAKEADQKYRNQREIDKVEDTELKELNKVMGNPLSTEEQKREAEEAIRRNKARGRYRDGTRQEKKRSISNPKSKVAPATF